VCGDVSQNGMPANELIMGMFLVPFVHKPFFSVLGGRVWMLFIHSIIFDKESKRMRKMKPYSIDVS
jgi:hypothetical protein